MISFPDINPIALQIGPLSIRWYGIAYAAGIVLAWSYLKRILRTSPPKVTIPLQTLDNLMIPLIIGIVVGGRLGFIFFYSLDHYLKHPVEIFMTWRGGMSFHGGVIGVIFAFLWYAYRNRLSFFVLTDIVVLGIPIGLFLGRLANFINGEHFGRSTDVTWAMIFPNGGPVLRHPSQIYEALGEGFVLFCILRWAWKYPNWRDNPGRISGLFLFGYGIIRCFLEFFRYPDSVFMGWGVEMTLGQILSLPLILLGLYLMFLYGKNKGQTQ